MTVPRRRFGSTEIQIPIFSCGGMRYQQSWDAVAPISPDNQANLEATIRRSVELGLNHIETARGYGTSEEQLGHVLPTFPRNDIIVQTKVGPEIKVSDFLRNFDTSMKKLKLDYVDLFALHGINNRERLIWSLKKGGCGEAALKLKEEGRIRHLGFSTHGACDVIVDAIDSGIFEYVNLHWYYVFQDNWPAVEAATKRDVGVFIISPSDKGGKLYAPADKFVQLCAPLSPIVFNDLFCLARSEVHTLSVGAARPTDFDEHLKVLPLLEEAEKHLAPILARLDAALAESLGRDWVDNWKKGLPRWEDVPGQIQVREILRLRNLVKAFGMVEYGQMRYNMLGNGDHWFPGFKADRLDGVLDKFTKAVSNSPFAAQIPDALREAHALMAGEEKKRLGSH